MAISIYINADSIEDFPFWGTGVSKRPVMKINNTPTTLCIAITSVTHHYDSMGKLCILKRQKAKGGFTI